jgi:hypothetical protein
MTGPFFLEGEEVAIRKKILNKNKLSCPKIGLHKKV